MKKFYVIVLVLVHCCAGFFFGKCPDSNSILPCTCEKNNEGKVIIHCEQVQCGEEIFSAMIAAKKQRLFMLQLKAVCFMFLPNGLFSGTKIQVLRMEDSSIFSLGERTSAFSGIEDSLIALEVSNCSFVNNWEWSELNKLKQLRHLRISDSELLELPNLNISHLPIEDLNFRGNFIKDLPSDAFNKFIHMKRLTLDSNDIGNFERSMLPLPARNLESIGLSHNNIEMLHMNTFDQMPALRYLYFGGNPILTLKEDTFKPVWGQLQMALFQDCPLICDCRLAWITTAKHAKVVLISGKCAAPENLKEKKISQLIPENFYSCL